jgi:hypothetical protein
MQKRHLCFTILMDNMTKSFPSRIALAILLALISVLACKKAPPPTAESLARHGPPSINQGAPPEPVVVPDGGSTEANLNQLSHALRKYIAGSHSLPKDFNDFLAKSGVQPPPPPAGKKYVIQGQVIALADQ